MKSQEKIDKDFTKARNYRVIREFRLKSQDDIVKILSDMMPGVDGIKQNVSLWENLKGNPGKKYLDPLAKILTVPIHVFSVPGLTKDYLETIENHTDMPKPDDNKEKPEDPIWTQIEKSEKYTVVPTIILDKYEILSNREIESRETTLQEVRATMKIAIAAKDQVIAILQKEIDGLNEKLKELPHTQQAQ